MSERSHPRPASRRVDRIIGIPDADTEELYPGTHGAIAASTAREVVLPVDLSAHTVAARGRGDRAELDVHSLHALITGIGPVEHAFVEKVAAMPGNGSVSMFRFGQACGSIYATLVVLGIPLRLRPARLAGGAG